MARRGSPARTAAVKRRIEQLKSGGMSQREIGRQLGISESYVRDIIKGRRGVSNARARKLVPTARKAGWAMRVPTAGTKAVTTVTPASKRDASKIGKYWSVIRYDAMFQDYEAVGKKLSLRQRTIRTMTGEHIVLTDDADELWDLDLADELTPDDIIVGNYRGYAKAA
jgi:transcriptional regulator with XRE-family HTH domain